MNKKIIALRIDDIGASTKQHEVYSRYRLGNILFLKYLRPFAAWGPYREMTSNEWCSVFELLQAFKAKLTVAVTASWVNYNGTFIPFDEKFPDVLNALKDGVNAGVIEIANHGLTHCVLKDNLFRPHLFKSNRIYHREFWDWIPHEVHEDHLAKSQDILSRSFLKTPRIFVPPGNVYTDATLDAAARHGIEIVNCNTPDRKYNEIKLVSNERVISFHDRELVLYGIKWLENILKINVNCDYRFVGELE